MNASEERALLEAAARAAGYTVERWSDDGERLLLRGVQEPWSSLADDGDALRLAVKLRLHITSSRTDAWVSHYAVTAIEPIASDPYAATRLAITRAAAQMDPEKT